MTAERLKSVLLITLCVLVSKAVDEMRQHDIMHALRHRHIKMTLHCSTPVAEVSAAWLVGGPERTTHGAGPTGCSADKPHPQQPACYLLFHPFIRAMKTPTPVFCFYSAPRDSEIAIT